VLQQQVNPASQCQQQQQHIHLSQPNINIACRGRSLPNVNQISSSSGIDLQVSYDVVMTGDKAVVVLKFC